MHMLGQDKATYLGNRAVQEFVEWLVNATKTGGFIHQWNKRTPKAPWSCTDLRDALNKYHWPFAAVAGSPGAPAGSTFRQNQGALVALGKQLVSAATDADMRDACINVFKWGGVRNGNVSWVNSRLPGLLKQVTSFAHQLDIVLNGGPTTILASPVRFNSGMTKVYSLMVDGLTIYDSRVAAALGLAVQRWAAKASAAIPPELQFPWMPSRGLPNRNPGAPFPRMNNHHQNWVWSALYASMVLGEVAAKSGLAVRELEAALFMIGYDVPTGMGTAMVGIETAVEVNAEDDDEHVCPNGWHQSFTPARGKPFCWTFDAHQCKVFHQTNQVQSHQRLISMSELVDMLRLLAKWFRAGHFPQNNNAVDVPAGDAPLGMGSAFYQSTHPHQPAPNSSRVTAICEDLGLLVQHAGHPMTWSLTDLAHQLMAHAAPCAFFNALVEESAQGE